MRVLITASTGLLGRALHQDLTLRGHELWTLDRRAASVRGLAWPQTAAELAGLLPGGLDAVVNLAGSPIAQWPWTERVKQELWNSRVGRTALLAEALALRAHREGERPALLSASAIGITRCGWPALPEEGAVADSFMGRLCRTWENAAEPAREAGLRLCLLRTGLVLDPAGGLLAKLLPVWRLGLGGRLGAADIPWSWIHREDWLGAVNFLLTERLDGPFNLCAPQPLTQAEALATLGRVLKRPAFLHLPGPLLALAGGEMAREVLLQAPAALPRRLLQHGFTHRHPELEAALRQLLLKPIQS